MIYIIIGLAILVIIFGYMALKMRLNHKLITKMSEDDLKLNTAKLAEKLRNPKSYGQSPQILSKSKKINNICENGRITLGILSIGRGSVLLYNKIRAAIWCGS